MVSIIEVKNGKVTIDNFETDVSEVVAYFETLKKELEEKKLPPEELQKQRQSAPRSPQ